MEDNEGCDMHDGDKIGCAEIGRLTGSKNKVIINEFEDFQKLIAKFHKVGKNFSKSSKNTMRFDETKKKHADTVPIKNTTVDSNTTRIAAVRILINDFLRMKKGLQYYAMDFAILASYWPSVTDWQQVREVEGILDLVRYLTTVAQYENYYMAAYGPVFKLNLYEKLRASTIDLVDISL